MDGYSPKYVNNGFWPIPVSICTKRQAWTKKHGDTQWEDHFTITDDYQGRPVPDPNAEQSQNDTSQWASQA